MREDLVIGVTTVGYSSNVAKEIRNMIEKLIPYEYGTLTRKMGAYREIASINIKDTYLRELALDEIIKQAISNKYMIDDRKANKILDRCLEACEQFFNELASKGGYSLQQAKGTRPEDYRLEIGRASCRERVC